MARTLASLEDQHRKLIISVTVGDVIILDDSDVQAMARMLEGRLAQGDEPPDAVVTTVNFCSSRLETNAEGPGIAALASALEEIAFHFGVEMPPHGRNRELVEFVIARL